MHYQIKVRWLSRGNVLKKCFELREEICQFMENTGKDATELKDKNVLYELAFLSDVVSHIDVLNLQLQGRGHIITDMYVAVRAFKTKLCLWKTQMLQGNSGHFPCCQIKAEQIFSAVLPSEQFDEKINALSAEFSRRLADFEAQKGRFELISNSFAMNVESTPTSLQMGLIELQCNDMLKLKYDSVGAAQFPYFLPDTMPQLRTQAAQMLSMFGSTYLCEQLFFMMKVNKTPHRSQLTDKHPTPS